jgi:hypothetical protein
MMMNVGTPIRRIASILSTITLLAMAAGCGSDSDGIQEAPVQITDSPSAPSISGAPGTTVMPGQTYRFTPQATDPNGDRLTFEIQNRPSWATFDTATGALTGNPSVANVGTYSNVTISVSDGRTRVSLPAFSIAVGAIGTGVATLSWTPPTQRTDGTALTNLAGYRIYYGSAPDEFNNYVEVNSAGIATYVVENLPIGTWYFVVSAVDSNGVESASSGSATKTIS